MTKERKYILIFGVILLLMGAAYRFWPENYSLPWRNDSLVLKQKKIDKYHAIVKQKDAVEKHLRRLDKKVTASSKVFLKRNTPSLAAVEIQNMLSKIAQKVEVSIGRIDIKKEIRHKDRDYISIPVNFSMISTTRQMRDMIYYIESSQKLLKIVKVNSSVRSKKKPEQISSSITVEGYILE
ncbi:MAG: hypothetical protein D3926_07745 [Desulfobacteraceae bacterium]|nr:MAG: hypothetical protein D3926_07745 [Desulfobacteraceae bacterium]